MSRTTPPSAAFIPRLSTSPWTRTSPPLQTWPGSDPTLPSLLFNTHIDSAPVRVLIMGQSPLSAHRDTDDSVFAYGAQDLEVILNHPVVAFKPFLTVHVPYIPNKEIDNLDNSAKFTASDEFKELNVGLVLDESQANSSDEFRVFYIC